MSPFLKDPPSRAGTVCPLGLKMFLAVRLLVNQPVSAALLVAAVAAAVSFQIPNTANLAGYTRELIDKGAIRSSGHIILSSTDGEPISDLSRLETQLRGEANIASYMPRYRHAGVMLHKTRHHPVGLYGVRPQSETAREGLCAALLEGSCIQKPTDILIGARLAERLKVHAGDRVKLSIPYQNLDDIAYASVYYTVSGILASGGDFRMDNEVFVHLSRLQEIVGHQDSATAILVFVKDPDSIAKTRDTLSSRFKHLKVRDWESNSRFITNAVQGNQKLSAISTLMVIAAVTVPVLALLYIHVIGQRRQIGILCAIGFRQRDVFWIYVLKSLLISLTGAIIGLILGGLLCRYFIAHPVFESSGFAVTPALSISAFAIPFTVVVVSALLAGLYPAIAASRENGVSALQRE